MCVAVDSFEGFPKTTVTNEEGRTLIKCTAEANHHPPQISWKLNNGPEFFGKLLITKVVNWE